MRPKIDDEITGATKVLAIQLGYPSVSAMLNHHLRRILADGGRGALSTAGAAVEIRHISLSRAIDGDYLCLDWQPDTDGGFTAAIRALDLIGGAP